MTVPTENITNWLRKLVQIPSVTPVQAGVRAGKPGELAMATAVAEAFRKLGGEVEREEVFPGRPNVYGIWRGTTDRWAALDVHTDVVSVEEMMDDPFDGRVENGRVWGRGAVDDKASLAVILAMLEEMWQNGRQPEPNLLIVATADEEAGGGGARTFAQWIKGKGIQLDELMVAEPTMCAPVHGHKGILAMEFIVHGLSAHSSKPHLGQNAINAAAHLILALEQENERLQTVPPTTELGPATMTVTIIEGGTGHNLVPNRCRVAVSKRLVPGEDPEADLDRYLALAEAACPLPIEMNVRVGLSAFYQPSDSPWIQQLAQWSGEAPTVAPYGTNALAYGDNVTKAMVILGPGSIDQAHGAVEWVEITELEKLARIYEQWLGL
jgi:acetylornithine deacetylase/succinyl-diaminopimelate desuccinylase-like protein